MQSSNLFNVKGKIVVVTGGGRGIGLMIAEGFVLNGATVYITSRTASAIESAAKTLTEKGPGVCIALPPLDLGKSPAEQGAKQLVDSLCEAGVSKVHVLFNNSGCSWGEPIDKYQEKGWDKVMNLNVKSLFYVTQACLPLLRAAATKEDPARIINIGSIAGLQPQMIPTYAYDTSKAAVHHLTRKLATDLAAENITVNAIAPGLFPSKMSEQLTNYASTEMLTSIIPLQRAGTPEDMAGISIFLSSRAGAFITGAVITIDGGSILGFAKL